MVLTEAKMRTQGIGVPDLGLKEICRFPVPIPPKEEQGEIADYLDAKVAELVAVAWAGERGRVRASATPARVAAAMGTWPKSRFSRHLRLLWRIGHTKRRQRAHHLRGRVQEAVDGA